MTSYECFDNDVPEALLQDLNNESSILAAFFPYNILIDLRQTALMTISTTFFIIVLDEIRILFVDCIIRQVHVYIPQVTVFRLLVGICSETRHTLVE